MPIKHKIDRRRRGRAVPRAKEQAVEESFGDVHGEGEEASADDNDEEEVSAQENDNSSVSSSKSEEEPDNPDDEDFELNENSSESEDDSEEEDYVPESSRKSRRGRVPARGKRKSPRRRVTRNNPVDDEEKEDSFDSDASSDVSPTQRNKNRGRSAHSSSEEEEYTPNGGRAGRSRRKQQRRAQTRLRSYRDDSSSEVEEESPARRSTPSRASAKRANEKLHETLDDESEEDEEESGGMKLPMLTPKKRKKAGSDEDEYVAGNEDDEEEEDDILSAEEDNESLVNEKIRNVDNESIGSMDSSNDGGNTGPSPELDIRLSRRRGRQVEASDSDDDDDASISEFRTTGASRRESLSVSCPSTHDVITMDPLPEKHVCYITPDRKSRQCFALETLHKIAKTAQIRQYRDDKQTFSQPPHFRSPMSDDLIDQIASRFGRAALDLDGYFYNRTKKPDSDLSPEVDYITNFDGSLAHTETFLERLNDYMSNLMGSQDVYCCPLCYTEAYRSLMNPDHSEDDDSEQENEEENEESGDGFVFSHDPMTILGSLDDDCFQLASTFCFTKISEVKRHLRDAHHVDTTKLDGNGLYTRFKIRESDGLLQRYIDNCHWMAYQGSMRRYWNEGNNQMFIQLLHLMKRTQYLNKLIKDDPTNENRTIGEVDKMILDDAEVFTRSFEKRAKRVWEQLSAPYRKMDKRELDEFLAGDDDDEDDEGVSPPVFNPALDGVAKATPEDQVIAELQKRRHRSGQYSQDDESDENGGDSEQDVPSDEDEESEEGSNYSEGSEQEPEPSSDDEDDDDWVKEVRGRHKARGKPTARRTSRGKRSGVGRKLSEAPSSSTRTTQPATSSRQRRRIIESDEDDY